MLLVVSGPSGVGKTTICRAIQKGLGGVLSVSVTTRPEAQSDVDGVDYHFVSQSDFDQYRHDGQLLEWAEVYGHLYGTVRDPVEEALANGKLVILEIDVQGAILVKKSIPDCRSIFVLPPDDESLLNRLKSRERDSEVVIQERLDKARQETALARSSCVYDHFVINDDLEVAIDESVSWIRRELAVKGRP
jgi:guanylate kinase